MSDTPAAQYRHGHDKSGTEHVVRQQKDGEVHSWPANFEDSGTDGALVHGAQPEGAKLRVLDLFSGIGGFSLGLERAALPGAEINGFETVAFCEIESFPRKVLAKHWPDVPCYDDVRTLSGEQLRGDGVPHVDVITGGFPCQDLSVAGRRAGIEAERSGLWSEIVRLACELRPQFIIVENVANLLSGPSERPGAWFGRVLGDLAEIGYDAEWHCIPASYLGAWHRRDRVWLLAYPDQERGQQRQPQRPLLRQRNLLQQSTGSFARWPGRSGLPQSRVCGRNDGVPEVVERLRCLGNAVVPQIPELIGNAILQSLHDTRGTIANRNAPALSGFVPFHDNPNSPEAQQ